MQTLDLLPLLYLYRRIFFPYDAVKKPFGFFSVVELMFDVLKPALGVLHKNLSCWERVRKGKTTV